MMMHARPGSFLPPLLHGIVEHLEVDDHELRPTIVPASRVLFFRTEFVVAPSELRPFTTLR